MPLFGPPNIEKLKATGNVKGLTKALNYKKDATIRQTAARALIEMGHVEALDKLGWQPDKSEAGAAYWIVKRQWDRCVEIGAPAVEPLAAALKEDNFLVRLAVIGVLEKIDDSRAVELLTTALMDREKLVSKKAARTLVGIGAPAVEPLIAALKDDKLIAAKVLGEIGDARAVEPLIATLKDYEVETVASREVTQALAKIGAPAVEPLVAVLKEDNFQVHHAAAKSLGEIGDARAVEALIIALEDKDGAGVGLSAAEALGKIGDARAVEPLIAALNSTQFMVPSVAAKALGKIGDAQAVEPLIAALKGKDHFVRSSAVTALESLGWQPLDDVQRALQALAHKPITNNWKESWADVTSHGIAAVEALMIALTGTDSDISKRAQKELVAYKDSITIEMLTDGLEAHDEKALEFVVGLLVDIGGVQAVELLIAALQNEKTPVRRRAAGALGQLEDVRAVEPLIAALKDEDSYVRQMAAGALGQFEDVRAVGELVTLAADHVAGETVVTALEQILKNNAGDVELTDLRAIADLQNVFQVKYVQNPDCDYRTKVDTEVDISQLIQIARQELIRRGLKA